MQDSFVAIGTALVICLISGPLLIPFLRRLKFGQHIRIDGPRTHLQKAGTPTMGGVMFFASIPLGILFTVEINPQLALVLLLTIGSGLLGFTDDFIKVIMKRPLGLRAREKIIAQILLAGIFAYLVVINGYRGTGVYLPGTGWGVDLGWFYIPFAMLVIVSANNAVNLTDGLDGLAAGTALFTVLGYVLITRAWGLTDLNAFSGALLGSCLGFLFFNSYPARLFMGDTGSLALGGAISSLAIMTGTELLLIILGGVFVIETLSDIIQIVYFRITGGKRVFKMAPLHHHFELSGWSEQKVVVVFWTAAALFTSLAVAIVL